MVATYDSELEYYVASFLMLYITYHGLRTDSLRNGESIYLKADDKHQWIQIDQFPESCLRLDEAMVLQIRVTGQTC